MSFEWKNFLELSRELLKTPLDKVDQEAQFRTAISRAYYCAYCSASEFIQRNDPLNFPDISREDSHKKMLSYFNQRTERQSKSVYAQLDRLKTYRKKADYDRHYANAKSDSSLVISASQAVVDSLNALDQKLNPPSP